ncbi:hypothetical protein FPOAC1_007608 [Fusarium poae]|uniref:hypothetical protein n=1 Tax=Fusarium poae TaxID=36050 RepID=UPI001CEBB985|nr:hypothetical protein FPOAC1_007608 [Fusarium poae]KAG8668231.1 hypothetical protein FPOAC1_007608 [Fusarium poae]
MTSASLFQSILPFWSNSYRSKKSRFKYSRLLTLEIRLLELQPGLPEDPLAGTILQRELAPGNRKIPDYEALSYCWGDQSHPQTISLAAEHHSHGAHSKTPTKSQCLEIGPNLASALKSLRYHDRSRILWCDSICINQRNLAERSSQVQRMGDVYRWAKRVVIWLGPETSWSRTIMEALRGLANQVPQTIDITRDWHRIGQVLGVNRTGPIPTTHDQLLAYEQLLDIDWHRRLWTFQEIAFANQETSIVRFGGEEMLWNMYKNSVMFMSLQVDNVSPACVKNVQVFTAKFMAGNMFGMGDSHEWVGFLHLTNRYECTDIRDRLYAIRGFLRTDVAQSIRVDYRKSAKQILASACVSHINRNGTLQFLELCNSDTKPTWTADLGKQLHTLSLTSSASGKSAASAVLVKSGVLEVAGVSCDEICSTPIVLPYKRFDQPEEEYMLLLIQFLQCLTGNEDFYNDDECLNELINMLKFGLLWDHDIAFTKSRPEAAAKANGERLTERWLPDNTKIRGVNLGSQFIIERWMAEESWKSMGCSAYNDEWACVEGIGQAKANAAFKKHWETWITEADIKEIASLGLNAVRIPVGYWMYEDIIQDGEYWPRGGIWHLDRISVPDPGFYTPENYERAYRFLEWMTKRIHTNGNYTTVGMLEVLNEPVHVPKWKDEAADMIKNYYPNAYKRITAMEGYLKVASSDRLHIQFMGKSWGSGDPRTYLPDDEHIFFDAHRYLSFDNRIAGNKKAYIQTACNDDMGRHVFVGEWSLSVNSTLKNTDEFKVDGQETWYKAYWAAQAESFEKGDGWFFWSWKCDGKLGKQDWRWCYQSAVAAGVIPKDAGSAAKLSPCDRYTR